MVPPHPKESFEKPQSILEAHQDKPYGGADLQFRTGGTVLFEEMLESTMEWVQSLL